MKEQASHMDDIGNPYLFGEKFEEKLTKVTNAKQKSKALFTGLQSKPAANHQQPFGVSPLSQNLPRGRGCRSFLGGAFSGDKITFSKSVFSTESGNSQSRDLHTCTSSNNKSDFFNKIGTKPQQQGG